MTTRDINYSPASPADEPAIRSLLKESALPEGDIAPHLVNFVVAKMNNRLIGVVGLEVHEQTGLLRSLAVEPEFRHQGIARALNQRIFARAHLLNLMELYLLTTTAVDFSTRLGFQQIERRYVPPAIQSTEEFASLCPQTAVCMRKDIRLR